MTEEVGERVDRVAETLVASVPFRLAPARSEEEREEIFRLRYRTVVEMGWVEPEDLPGGLERGEDDEGAALVGAWEGEELVGAARVVFPRAHRRLPIEHDFGLELDSDRTVEVGRVVIVPRLRGDVEHALSVALFAQCWLEMRALGFTELVCAAPERLLEIYRGLGFTVIELGPARQHWGEDRYPLRFDVLGSVVELERLARGARPSAAAAR